MSAPNRADDVGAPAAPRPAADLPTPTAPVSRLSPLPGAAEARWVAALAAINTVREEERARRAATVKDRAKAKARHDCQAAEAASRREAEAREASKVTAAAVAAARIEAVAKFDGLRTRLERSYPVQVRNRKAELLPPEHPPSGPADPEAAVAAAAEASQAARDAWAAIKPLAVRESEARKALSEEHAETKEQARSPQRAEREAPAHLGPVGHLFVWVLFIVAIGVVGWAMRGSDSTTRRPQVTKGSEPITTTAPAPTTTTTEEWQPDPGPQPEQGSNFLTRWWRRSVVERWHGFVGWWHTFLRWLRNALLVLVAVLIIFWLLTRV